VGEQFIDNLKICILKINQTSPHYIHCLKPNGMLQPGIFDVNDIAKQWNCNGILEAVHVTHAVFSRHYPACGLLWHGSVPCSAYTFYALPSVAI